MNINDVLKRRLLIVFLAIGLLVAGITSFLKLPLQAYPGVAPLTVQAISQWPGASTAQIEQQITIPVENALAGVPGVQVFRSVSLFGLSVVTVKFKEGEDSFKARQLINSYLNNLTLPAGASIAMSPDSDATGEIMRFALVSEYASPMQLKTFMDYEVYKELKHVQGISDISAFGGKTRQYQIIIKPGSLQAKNITLQQLIDAVTNSNTNVGGGLLPVGEQQLVVRGVGLLQTVDDMKRIVIAVNNGVPVRVGDIAQVQIGNSLRQGMFQYQNVSDGVEGIVLLRRGENASEVLDRVKEKIKEINLSILPPGISVYPFYDRQVLLDITLDTVKHTLFFGISLVLIILYIFLGNFRAAAVVAAVIPLALCVSFFNMDQFKVPANLISQGVA